MGREPFGPHGISTGVQFGQDIVKILLHEMREHEAVVNLGAPADEALLVGVLPESGDHRAKQEMLGEAHAGMGRHLEGAHFQKSQSSAGGFRGVELVDAEFGAMSVARGIRQNVAKNAIDRPRGDAALFRDLLEGDLEFIDLIVAGLVDARGLTGGADERAAEQE